MLGIVQTLKNTELYDLFLITMYLIIISFLLNGSFFIIGSSLLPTQKGGHKWSLGCSGQMAAGVPVWGASPELPCSV